MEMGESPQFEKIKHGGVLESDRLVYNAMWLVGFPVGISRH
jgi:hypothetical protein